jgi:hypothetical protein
MRIEMMSNGPVADFSVAGTTVTVAGQTVDCAAKQSDAQEVVDIRLGGVLAASLAIPPRRYVVSGEGDDAVRHAVALNPDEVRLRLWPWPHQPAAADA